MMLVSLLTGLTAIAFFYWFFSSAQNVDRVNESLDDIVQVQPSATTDLQQPTTITSAPTPVQPITIVQGSFMSAAIGHEGAGTALLLDVSGKKYLRLDDDFEVTEGPDLYIYFGKDDSYAVEAEVAQLKGNSGGQNYEIPAEIDTTLYNEVWIWCKAFSTPFAKAVLQ